MTTSSDSDLLQATLKNPTLPPHSFWLDEMDLSTMIQDWGEPLIRKNIVGTKLNIGKRLYERGVWTHASSALEVYVHGKADKFMAFVGLEEGRLGHGARREEGTVQFEVHADGKLKAQSKVFSGSGPAEPFIVDLKGAREVKLQVTQAGNTNRWAHAAWANAFFVMAEDFTRKPSPPIMDKSPELKIARIPRGGKSAPLLTGTTRIGASPGKPLLHRLTALGTQPLRFQAKSLPPGLKLDPHTGILTGRVAKAGSWRVPITVSNDEGKCSGILEILIGKRCLVPTPPMGWNSWNAWGIKIDREKILAAAECLIETRLADVGYQYINIDDGWERRYYSFSADRGLDWWKIQEDGTTDPARDSKGRILVRENFGDMKSLADDLHDKGFKLGIYSSPGPITCGRFEGSYKHEKIDAQTWAKWGIDFLKYDYCSYHAIAPKSPTLADMQHPYRLMSKFLQETDRDIVYSLCQYGMGDAWNWGESIGAHLWRTEGDIVDAWQSMISQAQKVIHLPIPGKPGAWHDPDMLVVGHVGWGEPHPTRLTRNEQITHISLWYLLSSPMLLGCDLTKLDDWTLNLLLNPEVVAINQDVLAAHPRLLSRYRDDHTGVRKDVWIKPLADGTHAVGLINWGYKNTEISVLWKELGLFPSQPVRDLWLRKDLGIQKDGLSEKIPVHGTRLFKVGKPK